MAKIIIFCFWILIPMSMKSQVLKPKYEARGVWLTTIGGIDWPHSYAKSPDSIERQKEELRLILNRLQLAGINTILLQTRIRATTIYPSAYEPWDGCLSGHPGVSPGYDALQFAIDEAHKRGMELHAWIVTIPVGKWNETGCRRLRLRHPGMIRKIGAEGYMNPESSETGNYLAQFCREIVDNYDVDGIHLDYIRYPETWPIRVSRPMGRSYITDIVQKIHHAVKSAKPWVKMSCAPIGKADDLSRYSSRGWNAYTRVCQDAQGWLAEGLMDELFPMMYFRDDQFYPFVLDWKEHSYGRIISIGLGTYMLSSDEKNWPLNTLSRELRFLRMEGLGSTHFRSKFLTDNTKGIYDFVSGEHHHYPALVPPMTWYGFRLPVAPSDVKLRKKAKHMELSWNAGTDFSDGDYLLYNIYASDDWPVDVSNPRHLVATRFKGNSILVPSGYHYAVCAVDRYGNESQPATISNTHHINPSRQLLRNDGKTLELPMPLLNQTDAEYIVAETLQGTIIATWHTARTLSIGHLPEGYYIVKALGRKGRTHRLGHLMIRRQS